MPISVAIEVHDDEDFWDGGNLGEMTSPADYIKEAQQKGGVFLPFREGVLPFLPISEIKMVWFDDGSGNETEED